MSLLLLSANLYRRQIGSNIYYYHTHLYHKFIKAGFFTIGWFLALIMIIYTITTNIPSIKQLTDHNIILLSYQILFLTFLGLFILKISYSYHQIKSPLIQISLDHQTLIAKIKRDQNLIYQEINLKQYSFANIIPAYIIHPIHKYSTHNTQQRFTLAFLKSPINEPMQLSNTDQFFLASDTTMNDDYLINSANGLTLEYLIFPNLNTTLPFSYLILPDLKALLHPELKINNKIKSIDKLIFFKLIIMFILKTTLIISLFIFIAYILFYKL